MPFPLRHALAAILAAGFAQTASATALSECLGFARTDKVLIVNADDIGMHPDLDKAAFALIDKQQIQDLSIMPPTPNFAAAAKMARDRKLAVGVHLTLTNEWQDKQSWGSVLPKADVPSLYNPQGRLWATTQEVARHADPAEVKKELLAQIAKVRAAGLTVTHLDAHMVFWAASPALLKIYTELPRETSIPIVMQGFFMPAAKQLEATRQIQAEGIVTPDAYFMHYNPDQRKPGQRYTGYDSWIGTLPAGINHLAIHPAEDSPSARTSIADLVLRLSDFEVWSSPTIRQLGKDLKYTDYRAMRALQDKVNAGGKTCLSR
ncbi:polysaccharide deacetylase family protein [Jeongeupia naejangsanensis]|uniref:Polysaccharide deacetylase family protein n=1 Tax=Jeongeupia naejangsanensis TaxID=613195 RepID=A0ABS2BH15_9NEIS|nr:polysaccharide deacetylase family protein [Jeongeupia naejangsanensis]MBM3114888.1 polysaccharide deacetylase family protein [Jeongeupia naejangsanensis]